MNNEVETSNVKFYEFGSAEKKQEKFNDALKSVTEKDIDILEEKLIKTTKEIIKKLVTIGVTLELNVDVKKIDNVINEVEDLIGKLIIEKESIRIWFFTSNKKQKKERYKQLEDMIDYLSNCQNELVSMKKEYTKLAKRKIKESMVDGDLKDSSKDKEDPLERTINFYIRKQERN